MSRNLLCFHQLNCCSSTCIHREMCALSSKILEDLKSLLLQERLKEMSLQLLLRLVGQQGFQCLFVTNFHSKVTVWKRRFLMDEFRILKSIKKYSCNFPPEILMDLNYATCCLLTCSPCCAIPP